MEAELMKSRIALVLLFLAALASQSAQAQGSRAESEVAIRQLEQRFIDTSLHNDWRFWDRMVAPEWTGIDHFGRQWDKPAILALLKNTKASLLYAHLYDVQVRFFKDDVAMASGIITARGTGAGREITLKYRSTDILAYCGGKWLVVASQATLVK
jgi:hypothetical protein